MKARQSPAPPGLLGASEQIGLQCGQLADIATSLAQGYADFPSIQARIQSEAAGLDSSQKNLVSTVQSMAGTASPSVHYIIV